MNQLRVECDDGLSNSARVYADGVKLDCVQAIRFNEMRAGELVTANVDFCAVSLAINFELSECSATGLIDANKILSKCGYHIVPLEDKQ